MIMFLMIIIKELKELELELALELKLMRLAIDWKQFIPRIKKEQHEVKCTVPRNLRPFFVKSVLEYLKVEHGNSEFIK